MLRFSFVRNATEGYRRVFRHSSSSSRGPCNRYQLLTRPLVSTTTASTPFHSSATSAATRAANNFRLQRVRMFASGSTGSSENDANDDNDGDSDLDSAATTDVKHAATGASASGAAKQNPLLDVNLRDLGVTVIRDRYQAKRALAKLMALPKDTVHACDTEVAGIDLQKQSPVGNGVVTCASVYCGPDVDFGSGPCLWIDNLDRAEGVLDVFEPYFADPDIKMVWHNYSFDRHVLYNHGIDCQGFAGDTMHMGRLWDTARAGRGGYSLEALSGALLKYPKTGMKAIFGRRHIKKDGTEGKLVTLPGVLDLQRGDDTRDAWIHYSCLDAKATWELHKELSRRLRRVPWNTATNQNMLDFYEMYIVPFAKCLTDMEREGIMVNMEYLKQIEGRAIEDKKAYESTFRNWVASFDPAVAQDMNINSATQIQQLLFAPCENKKKKETMPRVRAFDVPNTEGIIEEGKTKALKNRSMHITGLGLTPIAFTASHWPSTSAAVLRELAGSPKDGNFGPAFEHFAALGNSREAGEQACVAIDALCSAGAVDTLLSSFILPLQTQGDKDNRIHCSLNLNTETGRLSARRPNLQNQPALEKDIYLIRDAFHAAEGKKLIVADYGQLELRILAHMTKCKSMIDAFHLGGDFHSRTAMGMYPHVAEAVNSGRVLLERTEGSDPNTPLLKDEFAVERRKAKVLNFSIAYGKTAHGLAKDWKVSTKEAQETLDRWFEDRPEVRQWQADVIRRAHETGYTRTLMGRYRHLPDIRAKSRFARGHSERAAINTPIQGGAADIVMKAMLKLQENEWLRSHGWRQILQIHDEVILEGPEESSEEALERVKQDMMCVGLPKVPIV
eukprot:INCI16205.2.p1 GENE.INCI16205.2~~INCI16205.2.p1  ORF type:complete len:844 (-),score=149.57 INCI16205.2:102-2633(-)